MEAPGKVASMKQKDADTREEGVRERRGSGTRSSANFRSEMLRLFQALAPPEVISLFNAEYCGLCCIKFSGEKFCWKHYNGRGHAALLQKKTYRNRPLPWQMVFHALIANPEGASKDGIQEFMETTFSQHLGGRDVRKMIDDTLVDMVDRFQNVVNLGGVFKLRERSPGDRPMPIPTGCNREERRRGREWEVSVREERGRERERRAAREEGGRRGEGGEEERWPAREVERRLESEVEWWQRRQRETQEWEGRGSLWSGSREQGGGRGREDLYCRKREDERRSRSRSNHRQERTPSRRHLARDCKNMVRSPDSTPPRRPSLRPCPLPRHQAFGPVGSARPALALYHPPRSLPSLQDLQGDLVHTSQLVASRLRTLHPVLGEQHHLPHSLGFPPWDLAVGHLQDQE